MTYKYYKKRYPKRTFRKRRFRRRRPIRKSGLSSHYRALVSHYNMPYRFKRSWDGTGDGLITANTSGAQPSQVQIAIGSSTAIGFHFTFDVVNNYTEFTALFDQYMITKIVIRMKLKYNPIAQSVANTPQPDCIICRDHDDDTFPT